MGRRKIPKSSREEINRISAEKQERILRHLSEAGALTIKKTAEDLGLTHSDARNQFGNLRVKNAIDCVGRCKDGYLYTIGGDPGRRGYLARDNSAVSEACCSGNCLLLPG